MPKVIINEGIAGKGVSFPHDALGTGVALDQTSYLFVLTGVFLVLVVIQQVFKYTINVFQGISGERMLRRLRYELYSRVLRFPLPVFKGMSAGEIIPMITAEVEPLGGFIAEAFALPLFQGGMLLVIFGFLLVQNPIMALAAVALYPLQFYIVPKLQRRVNMLAKERVRTQRMLADRIGESIGGVQEVHVHDASRRLRAEFARRLGRIYWIRYEIYQRKFVIKFINNFIQQLGPFFFYSIGGYLTIRGQLDIGTVIAVVNAHKEMASPWKELLTHYQQREDVRIKYDQVIAQFRPAGLLDVSQQLAEPDRPSDFNGPLTVGNLSFVDERGESVLEGISLDVPLPGRVAVIGGPGREEFLLLLARQLLPTRGSIAYNGVDIAKLPESVTGRRLAYVGQSSYVFSGTMGDNLFFSLRHRMLAPPANAAAREKLREMTEALASGNSTDDPEGEWTDYQAADVSDAAGLRSAAVRTLHLVGLADDTYQLGLRGTIDPRRRPELAERILDARKTFRSRLHDPATAELVETWDRGRYNGNATVAENLLFGTPVGRHLESDRLARSGYVMRVLTKVGLRDRFLAAGREVAKTMVELFADLPPGHEFFQQFSFISSEDLPEFAAILTRVPAGGLKDLSPADQQLLLSLPFKLIPERHRLGVIDAEFQAAILQAREVFAAELPAPLRRAVAFFDVARFSAAANLVDNIVFGKIVYGKAQAADKVGRLIGEVVDELGLRDVITEAGLDFAVGVGGARLSAAQRQKLALARAVIKRPDVLILAEATAALDATSQGAIMERLFAEFTGRSIVWALHNPALAEQFDHVIVLSGGRVQAHGKVAEFNQEGTDFKRLAAQA